MKKICSFLALILFSAMSFAASITAPNVNFGTVSIKGQTLPVTGSETVKVTFSGLATEGYYMYAEVTDGLLDDETQPSGFYVTPDTKYLGYGVGSGTLEFEVHYSVKTAGTFNGKLHFSCYDTSYEEVHGYANITITVTNEAIVAKTIPFERVTSLADGDTIIFVSEAAGAVSAPLKDTYLQVLTDGVTIDATNHTAEVPETGVQMFRAVKYSGNWQFYTVEATPKRLHLDASGKGAFTYAATSETVFANWAVSFNSSGAATVCKPDDTFPVEFNSDRFKPYKSPQNSTYQIYKKKGSAAQITSKLEIGAIDFGTVELSEEKEVVVNYTAENLTDDIVWDFTGADKALFSVTPELSTNRTSGSVTVKYLGTAAAVKTISANLYALTQDAALDELEKEVPISITLKANTIKLTKIEFVGVPDSLIKGKSIDLKPYLVYTPGNAEDKSLTWTVDKSYQGTVADGVYTAKEVTGNVTITATSVKVPSVSASVTIMQYEPKPASITLDKHEITTTIGEVVTLQGIVGPDGASQDCYFTIRNTSILSYAKGDVTGSAKLTAKALCPEGVWVVVNPKNYQTILDSCLVKVIPVAVESVAFDPDTKEMTVGAQYQLTPVVTPSAAASQYTASYVSNKTSVATVSETGLVTAVAEGTAEITCTLGGKSGKITISVVDAPLFTKVTDISSLKAKDTIILALQSAPVIAGAIDGKKLTALTSGITVTDAGAYADAAYKLVIGTIKNKTGFSLQPVGSTKVLAEQNNDLYLENTTSTKNLMWEFVADGTNGIFVRNLGNSDAMFKYHAGNAAIKPYKAGTVGAVYVYVYVRPYTEPIIPAAEGVSLDQTTLDFYVGDADVTLKATVTPSGADQAVIWESSNTAVATVSTSGKVHAVAKGTATITAKVKSNETLKAECAVTVNEHTPEDKGAVSIADFLAAKDEFNIYTLTGVVSNIKMGSDGLPNKYGNFDLTDATGTIYIYGLLTADSVAQKFQEMGIEAKDTVTLKGSYSEHNGNPQVKNALFVSVKKYVDPTTAIDAVRANKQATKVIRERQVIIIREEKEYDVVGRQLK